MTNPKVTYYDYNPTKEVLVAWRYAYNQNTDQRVMQIYNTFRIPKSDLLEVMKVLDVARMEK